MGAMNSANQVGASVAIACAAGSFRGAFVHGVLSAFQEKGFRAAAYAAASSSVIPTAFAVLGQLEHLEGAGYWKAGLVHWQELDHNISEMILRSIHRYSPILRSGLFTADAPRFLIATSAVLTEEAAQQTQGDGARRLGRKLLIATRRKDRSWAEGHLALHLFGTLKAASVFPLTPGNLEHVMYASTRMLHAWKTPASIDGRPYVDASYTCSCPAVEMAQLGYAHVVAIVPEPGPAYRDIFQSERIPSAWENALIHIVQPDLSLSELGVDLMAATPAGFEAVFRYGEKKGAEFLKRFKGCSSST